MSVLDTQLLAVNLAGFRQRSGHIWWWPRSQAIVDSGPDEVKVLPSPSVCSPEKNGVRLRHRLPCRLPLLHEHLRNPLPDSIGRLPPWPPA